MSHIIILKVAIILCKKYMKWDILIKKKIMSHSLHFFSLLSYGLSLHITKNITHSPCSNVIIYYYSETSSSSLSSSSASRTVSIHCWFQISTHPSSLSTLNLATSVNNCELLGLRNDICAV